MWWVIILSVFLFIAVFWFSNVEFHISYDKNNFAMNLSLIFLGIVYYSKKLTATPKAKGKKGARGKKKKLKREEKLPLNVWIKILQKISRVIVNLFKQIAIRNFTLHITYASGNYARDAEMYGLIWTIISLIYCHIENIFRMESSPEIELNPTFNTKQFKIKFKSILKCRTGHIIWAGIKIFLIWRKRAKEAISS